MEREDILKRIEEIREELAGDRYALMKAKILERRLHLHRSARNPLSRLLIARFRNKLKNEVELILGPVLDNQREINLRFLDEIERLKQACLSGKPGSAVQKNEKTDTPSAGKDQE